VVAIVEDNDEKILSSRRMPQDAAIQLLFFVVVDVPEPPPADINDVVELVDEGLDGKI
jgi:hypothetical protein